MNFLETGGGGPAEIVVQVCFRCSQWTAHTSVYDPGRYIDAHCRRCGFPSHDRTRKDEPWYYRGASP